MELTHAILGLLALRPMSGYDLRRAFETSVAHFWHADQSQIYRTLERLAADGAVTTERIPQERRPDRKVHTPTETGLQMLDEWLRSPVEPERSKEPFLARIFFAARLDRDAVATLIDEREHQLRELVEHLEAIAIPAGGRRVEFQAATRELGIQQAATELRWLATLRRRNADLPEE